MFRPCLVAALLCGVASACSADGHTPDCPELPRYDVRQPLSDAARAKLIASANQGCITLPVGFTESEGGAGGSN
jgi:hypothetical protein